MKIELFSRAYQVSFEYLGNNYTVSTRTLTPNEYIVQVNGKVGVFPNEDILDDIVRHHRQGKRFIEVKDEL